jgi:lysophospholipase L1-like esterase
MPETGKIKRGGKRWVWKLIYVVGVSVLLLFAGEFTARIQGFRPWKPEIQKLEVKPGGSFFQPDSLLGYKGRPGRFELLLKDSLSFVVTHDEAGWRLSSDSADQQQKPEIWIFGCSFSHGYGVNDAEAYPWLLQTELPRHRVCNFAMDGYGTLHSYLQLKDLLSRRQPPALVILAYGAFHDQRNTANRYWQKALHGQEIAEGISYPFVRLDENDSLNIRHDQLSYHPLPFQRHLALLSLLEENWNHNEDQGLRSKRVTEVLIQKMLEASRAKGSKFLIAGIYKHHDTEQMLRIFHLENVPTVDISQDLSQPELRILPGNGHPNAKAHALMAMQLLEYFNAHPALLETQN